MLCGDRISVRQSTAAGRSAGYIAAGSCPATPNPVYSLKPDTTIALSACIIPESIPPRHTAPVNFESTTNR